MTRSLSVSFFGGPWDGLQVPWTSSPGPASFDVRPGIYTLDRIDRAQGTDGMEHETASYAWKALATPGFVGEVPKYE